MAEALVGGELVEADEVVDEGQQHERLVCLHGATRAARPQRRCDDDDEASPCRPQRSTKLALTPADP